MRTYLIIYDGKYIKIKRKDQETAIKWARNWVNNSDSLYIHEIYYEQDNNRENER
jgi:hypothetical protein